MNKKENQYSALARRAAEEYKKTGKRLVKPDDLPEDFYSRQAGVFVTIFNQGELRGCIGTFLPVEDNLAEEIISNAIAACSRDNRFAPITVKELPRLDYEVSILSAPEKIKDLSGHDPKKFGLVVASGRRKGLLLPDLEGVETAEEQAAIAAQKGGIDLESDRVEFFRFTVEKH